MKRAVAYARVSSNKQSETSIETQFDEIEAFSKNAGIQIVKRYQDKITASGEKERPQFTQMIVEALSGDTDLILVYKYDRFIRDDLEDQKLIRELEQKNVYVISCAERIDTTTPSGRLQRWLISGLNKFYLENLRDEIYTKTTKVAEKGYYLGGNVLYGYTLREVRDKEAARTRKVYEINEQEAIVVRKIFEMFANKESYNKIIAYLNEHFRNRAGQSWSKSTIMSMLKNKKYVGIYTYREGNKHTPHAKRQDKIEISGLVPPIVDAETFQKVQERLQTSNIRYQKSQSLCRGIIYCGICGAKMTTRRGKESDQYVCSRFYAKRDTEYNGMSVNKVDQFVLGYIRQILTDPDYESIAKGYNEEAALRDEAYKERIDALKLKQKELEDKIQNAVEAVLNKSPLADVLQEKATQLRHELEQTKDELSKVLNQGMSYVTIEMIKEKFEEYKHKLESDTDEQRELVLSLIEKVVIYKGYIEIIARDT